ncbi:uncharacterized protein LOC135174548 isoform X5 [Pogoniulus pusillus]|uniref:uncharacterized protein LOC135174548 isoform X5 n=1 Tax=Pogoniulus pusillus TaxID=488313 RepID=UPI0030B96E28
MREEQMLRNIPHETQVAKEAGSERHTTELPQRSSMKCMKDAGCTQYRQGTLECQKGELLHLLLRCKLFCLSAEMFLPVSLAEKCLLFGLAS